MEWQILTTFFSLMSLVLLVVILMAQAFIKRSQTSMSKVLVELLSDSHSLLSIVREMDKQQDLFVRQMPPHEESAVVVHPMDTKDLPAGLVWMSTVEAVTPEIIPAERKATSPKKHGRSRGSRGAVSKQRKVKAKKSE